MVELRAGPRDEPGMEHELQPAAEVLLACGGKQGIEVAALQDFVVPDRFEKVDVPLGDLEWRRLYRPLEPRCVRRVWCLVVHQYRHRHMLPLALCSLERACPQGGPLPCRHGVRCRLGAGSAVSLLARLVVAGGFISIAGSASSSGGAAASRSACR